MASTHSYEVRINFSTHDSCHIGILVGIHLCNVRTLIAPKRAFLETTITHMSSPE